MKIMFPNYGDTLKLEVHGIAALQKSPMIKRDPWITEETMTLIIERMNLRNAVEKAEYPLKPREKS